MIEASAGSSPVQRLKGLLFSRSGVLVLTTLGTVGVRMASSVTLSRLLTPSAFGLLGIIMSAFVTIALLTDLGFQSFVVRHERGDSPHFRNVIWTIHAWRGAALTILAIACAPLVGLALDKPEITWPFAGASLTFLLNGLASLSLMTAIRNDGSRKLSMIDLGLQVFQTIVCIAVAIVIRNVWALIIAMLVQAALRAVLSYTLYPDSGHRPARDKDLSREFFAFSRVVLVSSAMSLLISQSDKLVLARLLTLSEFGLYAIALNLVSAPVSFGDNYIGRVVFPIYAQTFREAPETLARIYYEVRRKVGLLYAFGCGGIMGGAGLMIAILYDPRYRDCGPFLSLLMISAAIRFPNFAAAEVMTATGRIKVTLYANIARLVWLGIAVPTGYWLFGAIGVIGAVGLLEVPTMLYSWFVLRQHDILDLRQEGLFLAVVGVGAGIGYAISSTVLGLFPAI